ncbi:MAG: hypothetical protein ACNI27_04325 [Desulfovibrio sp.]
MEKAVLKIARQILSYDEASLTSLWEHFASRVDRYEPSTRWEEAAVALGVIQAVRMKNQLFNYQLAQSRLPLDDPSFAEGASADSFGSHNKETESLSRQVSKKRGKILQFPGVKSTPEQDS